MKLLPIEFFADVLGPASSIRNDLVVHVQKGQSLSERELLFLCELSKRVRDGNLETGIFALFARLAGHEVIQGYPEDLCDVVQVLGADVSLAAFEFREETLAESNLATEDLLGPT